MKEIITRSLIALVGFLVTYLLMTFVVASFDITQWAKDERGTAAIIEGILIVMISTFPGKITKEKL